MQRVMILIGTPGCLSGDTEILINRGKRAGGRIYSLERTYHLFNSLRYKKNKRY